MPSTSSNKQIVKDVLSQISHAIEQLVIWNENISTPDDYYSNPEGVKTLAASSMLIEAIGEGIKKIDRRTSGRLLSLRPEIPWNDVMGIRDHIAHGYFDIDGDIIFATVKQDLPALAEAITFLTKAYV